jgi:hypothetical protein
MGIQYTHVQFRKYWTLEYLRIFPHFVTCISICLFPVLTLALKVLVRIRKSNFYGNITKSICKKFTHKGLKKWDKIFTLQQCLIFLEKQFYLHKIYKHESIINI